jgi:hypothetical protein
LENEEDGSVVATDDIGPFGTESFPLATAGVEDEIRGLDHGAEIVGGRTVGGGLGALLEYRVEVLGGFEECGEYRCGFEGRSGVGGASGTRGWFGVGDDGGSRSWRRRRGWGFSGRDRGVFGIHSDKEGRKSLTTRAKKEEKSTEKGFQQQEYNKIGKQRAIWTSNKRHVADQYSFSEGTETQQIAAGRPRRTSRIEASQGC